MGRGLGGLFFGVSLDMVGDGKGDLEEVPFSHRRRCRLPSLPLSSISRLRMLSRREGGRRGGVMLAPKASSSPNATAPRSFISAGALALPLPLPLAGDAAWSPPSRGIERAAPVPRATGAMLSDSRAATVHASISTVTVEASERECWCRLWDGGWCSPSSPWLAGLGVMAIGSRGCRIHLSGLEDDGCGRRVEARKVATGSDSRCRRGVDPGLSRPTSSVEHNEPQIRDKEKKETQGEKEIETRYPLPLRRMPPHEERQVEVKGDPSSPTRHDTSSQRYQLRQPPANRNPSTGNAPEVEAQRPLHLHLIVTGGNDISGAHQQQQQRQRKGGAGRMEHEVEPPNRYGTRYSKQQIQIQKSPWYSQPLTSKLPPQKPTP